MYPYHFPILFQFNDALSECTVDINISLPQFLPSQIIFEIVKALEVIGLDSVRSQHRGHGGRVLSH